MSFLNQQKSGLNLTWQFILDINYGKNELPDLSLASIQLHEHEGKYQEEQVPVQESNKY